MWCQVDKAVSNYYELQVDEQHLASGFVVGVHSKIGSRFKLLLFERNASGQWELLLQVLRLPRALHAWPGLAC